LELKTFFVSDILHHATIDVDTIGTVARAVTYTPYKFGTAVAAPSEAKPIFITIDRPFLYLVMSADHCPLFTGICVDPICSGCTLKSYDQYWVDNQIEREKEAQSRKERGSFPWFEKRNFVP